MKSNSDLESIYIYYVVIFETRSFNIDLSKNDGRPDAFVSPNEFFQFSEYQFSVDNLEQFTGFVIKVVMISTNESYPVFIKDFRAIALA